ncbi:MAG: AI-2E family transporter [Candidatus Nomurabacteria bacterium]|nr:MAG: AI-2E family transporter [Candidatus Nomurabacteria bacterium]
MKVRIEIETKTFVRFWLVIAAFLLVVEAIIIARQALIILGTAFFLALALNRPVTALANKLPGKSRVGGTAIAYVIVVGLIGVFLSFVVPPIIEQTARVVESLPSVVDQIQTQWHGLHKIVEHYGLQTQVNQALDSIRNNATDWAAHIGSNLINSVGSLFGFLTSLFLVLVLSFLMLVEAPNWLKLVWGVYNDQDRMKAHRKLAVRMYNVVTGYVTGQLAVSGIGAFFAGLTVFVMSFIFHVPVNLALPTAAIAFLLSLIPMFGATIGGILICLLLAFNDLTASLVFAIYFVIYQQIENNFISPAIQSKTVELSALAILGSVTVGLYLFGIAGGIISIPIAGCIKVLLEAYVERAKKHRTESEKHSGLLVKKIQDNT